MIVVPKTDYVQFLIQRKFSELRRPPSTLLIKYGATNGITYGDDEIDDFWEPPEAVLQDAEVYRQELLKLPPAEIKALYDVELEKRNLEDDQRRFFSEPKAAGDFEHWGRMELWSLDEAISLSFGKDPRIVFWSRIESILSYLSPFVSKYHDLREIVGRAVLAKVLTNPVKPEVFVAWAEKNGIPLPEKLTEIVKNRGQETPDWQTRYDDLTAKTSKTISEQEVSIFQLTQQLEKALAEKPLQTRERNTAYKLIVGMAAAWYGYDPKIKKSTTVSEITSDLQRVGISVDEETLRRWLQNGSEFLPENTEKD